MKNWQATLIGHLENSTIERKNGSGRQLEKQLISLGFTAL